MTDDDDIGPLAKRIVIALQGRSGGWLERTANLPKGYGSYITKGKRRKLGPEMMERIADALGVRHSWLAAGVGPMVDGEKAADPKMGTFLLKLDRLPGLRAWVEEHPSKLTVSEVARGILAYETFNFVSREDGQPHGGWDKFFDDVLAGRLTTTKKKGDQKEAEAAERRQLSSATRKLLKR